MLLRCAWGRLAAAAAARRLPSSSNVFSKGGRAVARRGWRPSSTLQTADAGGAVAGGKGVDGSSADGVGSSMYSQPALYDEVFGFRDFEVEVAFVRAAYKRHCPGRPLGSVLELGCGPARHAALLAKSGAHVWALDSSEEMLAHARREAEAASADVAFLQGDMADFAVEGMESRLDLVLSLLGTFSHMTTNAAAVGAFTSVARHLRPGGMLLLELAHPGDLFDGSLVISDEGGEMWEVESASRGVKLLVEWGAEGDDFDPATQILRRTVSVSRLEDGAAGELLHESVVPQRAFTLQEIDLLGRLAGLALVGAYGDLDLGVGLGHEDAYRLVACLVKQP